MAQSVQEKAELPLKALLGDKLLVNKAGEVSETSFDAAKVGENDIKNREIAAKQRVPDEERICRKCWMLNPVSLCNGVRPFCRTPINHCDCVDIASQTQIECAPCQKEKELLTQPIVAALSDFCVVGNVVGVIMLYINDVRHYECVECSSAVITIVNDDYKRAIDSAGDPCGYTVDVNDSDTQSQDIRVFCPKCAHKQEECYEFARIRSQRAKGVCRRFHSEKGFGFIACDDGSGDVFVHQTELYFDADGRYASRSLAVGETLEFDIEIHEDGINRKAVNVTGPYGAFVKGRRADYSIYDLPQRPIQHGAFAQIEHMLKYAQIVRCARRYTNYAAFEKKQKQKKKPKGKKKRRRQRKAKNEAKSLETATNRTTTRAKEAMLRRWAKLY